MAELREYIPGKIPVLPGIDFWELRLEERITTLVFFKGDVPQQIGESVDRGGNCRAMCKGGYGFATFNNPENLARSMHQAQELAKTVGKRPGKWRERGPVRLEYSSRPQIDPHDVPLQKKVAWVRSVQKKLVENRLVDTTSAGYSDLCLTRIYINSEGSLICETGVHCKCFASATNTGKGSVETVSRSFNRPVGYELVDELEEVLPDMTKELSYLTRAQLAKGGSYTVIVDPLLAGVFAHESFGHTSESDFIQGDERIKEIMRLSRRIASPVLSIYDDGTIPNQCGSLLYDDEGTPAQKTALITKGVLTSHLHSRETAYNMGEEPTGNARAINYGFPPIVRMTNTYITPSVDKLSDLIASVDRGILVCDSYGGTGGEMFSFSAKYGMMIEGGKTTRPVKNFTLTGNLFKTLKNIVAVSDDFQLFGSWAGCGKNEQMPLSVGLGGPYVMIKDVLVGGR
jgi:TldD protein